MNSQPDCGVTTLIANHPVLRYADEQSVLASVFA
jgi:hypothetical protein